MQIEFGWKDVDAEDEVRFVELFSSVVPRMGEKVFLVYEEKDDCRATVSGTVSNVLWIFDNARSEPRPIVSLVALSFDTVAE